MKKIIQIEGMHCEKCQARVEKTLSQFGQVEVDLTAKTACVLCDVDDAVLKDEVESLGFDVISITTK